MEIAGYYSRERLLELGFKPERFEHCGRVDEFLCWYSGNASLVAGPVILPIRGYILHQGFDSRGRKITQERLQEVAEDESLESILTKLEKGKEI